MFGFDKNRCMLSHNGVRSTYFGMLNKNTVVKDLDIYDWIYIKRHVQLKQLSASPREKVDVLGNNKLAIALKAQKIGI